MDLILNHLHPIHTHNNVSLRSALLINSHLSPFLPSGFFPEDILAMPLYIFSPVHATHSNIVFLNLVDLISLRAQSQWPRLLRRGCGARRLLGLQVRIPPGNGSLSFSLSGDCCAEREISLRWADHSSRRIHLSVGCLSVIVKPLNM